MAKEEKQCESGDVKWIDNVKWIIRQLRDKLRHIILGSQ